MSILPLNSNLPSEADLNKDHGRNHEMKVALGAAEKRHDINIESVRLINNACPAYAPKDTNNTMSKVDDIGYYNYTNQEPKADENISFVDEQSPIEQESVAPVISLDEARSRVTSSLYDSQPTQRPQQDNNQPVAVERQPAAVSNLADAREARKLSAQQLVAEALPPQPESSQNYDEQGQKAA